MNLAMIGVPHILCVIRASPVSCSVCAAGSPTCLRYIQSEIVQVVGWWFALLRWSVLLWLCDVALRDIPLHCIVLCRTVLHRIMGQPCIVSHIRERRKINSQKKSEAKQSKASQGNAIPVMPRQYRGSTGEVLWALLGQVSQAPPMQFGYVRRVGTIDTWARKCFRSQADHRKPWQEW